MAQVCGERQLNANSMLAAREGDERLLINHKLRVLREPSRVCRVKTNVGENTVNKTLLENQATTRPPPRKPGGLELRARQRTPHDDCLWHEPYVLQQEAGSRALLSAIPPGSLFFEGAMRVD